MDVEEFRKHGKDMVDYICEYMKSLQDRQVIPDVQPGYLRLSLPGTPPEQPETWESIMKDVEDHVMRGVTHWQHPRFHAYFPAGNAYPSIMGGMLGDALGIVGFSWAASPACAELEMLVLDWLAKMTHMPQHFQHESGLGGGVMQGSASDSILVTMLAARRDKLNQIKREHANDFEEGKFLSRLVAYCSKLAHSCVEKAGMISCIQVHQLDYDPDDLALQGRTLQLAIDEDRRNGLIPFFVCAVLGTTACASCDDLESITEVCQREGLWCHVDAAYAGSAFICEELTYFLRGVENVDSYNFNPNKWMLINFDCSVLWVRDKEKLTSSMIVDPVYLQHKHSSNVVDFRHWGIPLSRRFRALKVWFVIRSYGVEGLRRYIRNHCKLAKLFESQVKRDSRFELVGQVHFGLVCFHWKDSNALTQYLIRQINDSGKLHMVPATVKGQYIIRFALCSEHAKEEDVFFAWNVIKTHADEISTTIKTLNMWTRQAFRNSITKEVDIEQDEGENGEENGGLGGGSPSEVGGGEGGGEVDGEVQVRAGQGRMRNSKSLNQDSLSDAANVDPAGAAASTNESADAANNEESVRRSLESLSTGVKVEDSDLGVGVSQEQKRLRRSSLLRMISDPYTYPGCRPGSGPAAMARGRAKCLISSESTANSDLSVFDENVESEEAAAETLQESNEDEAELV